MSVCTCTRTYYDRFLGVVPESICAACEERMEDEARQERFEREYENIDPQTGYPA